MSRVIKLMLAAFVIGLVVLTFNLSKKSGITVTPSSSVPPQKTVSVTVSATGTIQFEGLDVPVSELTERVRDKLLEAGPQQDVQFEITAARDTPNMLVVETMDALRKGGATNVAMSIGQ